MTRDEKIIRAVHCLYVFYRHFAWHCISQDDYVDNWHIAEISKYLQDYKDAIVARKPIKDLIVNIPPGSSKSSLISQTFPVWLWLHDPTICIIISSYSNALSTDHSLKAKNIIHNGAFESLFQNYIGMKHGRRLKITKDNEGYWINNYGGQYVVTSTGAAVTGRHAHVIIRDDPISPEQAHSDAYRVRAHRFNDATLSTRKKNKESTPIITVMQRLHEEDTTGHDLAKEKEINHICLPSVLTDKVKPERFKGFYVDGLLDVNRMSKDILHDQKADLGTYGYSGQFLQEPYPEDGGKIKKEWFCFLDAGELSRRLVWDIWIDGAYTDKTSNDPTGIMICAHDLQNNRLIVRLFESKYLILPDLVKHIDELEDHGLDAASRGYVEPKASGYSIIQELQRRTKINAVKIVGKLVQAGKEARLNTSSPKIEGSRVWLVKGNWNEEFIKQHIGFPNTSHDEAVDLLGYACKKYFY